MERAVAQVEDNHAVPVEVVVVGDRPIDGAPTPSSSPCARPRSTPCATRRPPVRVYVEVADDAVEAYVSDRGDGFDLDAVPEDRLGVRESVLGRMAPRGRPARVRRPAAGGTEVVLELPVARRGTDATRSRSAQHVQQEEAR